MAIKRSPSVIANRKPGKNSISNLSTQLETGVIHEMAIAGFDNTQRHDTIVIKCAGLTWSQRQGIWRVSHNGWVICVNLHKCRVSATLSIQG
ncbi:hypothetical protein AGR1C_Lc80215 [Agrobacterium fabacearum TT111]|nr:hypothetical protein AGR1C_Lc80215 [Agrobacterium fabacearum TT111]